MSEPTLSANQLESVVGKLSAANRAFLDRYPGESSRRQPVHVVYGGAHLFKSDSAKKLGAVALQTLEEYAPDANALAHALKMPWSPGFSASVPRFIAIMAP